MDVEMDSGSLPSPFTSRQATGCRNGRIRLEEDVAKEDEWRWAVAQTFFDHRSLVADHISSYNYFVEKGIHEMFQEAEPFEVNTLDDKQTIQTKVVVSFEGVEVGGKPEVEESDRLPGPWSKHVGHQDRKGKGERAPDGEVDWVPNDESGQSSGAVKRSNLKLLPVEARMRGITYSSPIYVNVTVETTTTQLQGSDPPAKSAKSSRSSSTRASSSRSEVVTDERKTQWVLLGSIPVMVKSSLCHLSDSENAREPLKGDCCLDPGGYFIIKGSEKVMVAQEERTLQRLWVSCLKGVWMASCTAKRRGFSNHNYHRTSVLLTVPKNSGPIITVTITGIQMLPIGVLFSALGVSSDREILKMICYDLDDTELVQSVCPSLDNSHQALAGAVRDWDASTFSAISKRDKDVALFYIGSKTLNQNPTDDQAGKVALQTRFLPQMGSNDRKKTMYLAYMVRSVLLCFLKRQQETDRDDMKNKRLEFAGEIICHQVRKTMGQVISTMEKRMEKHLTRGIKLKSTETYLDHKILTRGLKMAFSSGTWRGHDNILKNSGVVFSLDRQNPLSTICQLRELRRYFAAPTNRVGDEARCPTFSQWGRVCPIDTPDEENCGLVKNMALAGLVSSPTPEDPLLKLLAESDMQDLESMEDSSRLLEATKLFLNGRWVGVVADSREAARLADITRRARRQGPDEVDLTQVEVVLDINRREIHISTDGGRILRPLLIVRDQALVLNEEVVVAFQNTVEKDKRFQWLLSRGVVELMGIEEEEMAMVAHHGEQIWNARETELSGQKAVKFTHAELHPSLVLGLSASLIPFPNRNQSSRNLYQAHKHGKQAMGFYVTNKSFRVDTTGQHLFYPQVQLVKTKAYECLQKPELFSGQNAVVAVACYTGYNQEDSIIMGQSSLDRGMFRTTHYRTFSAEERTNSEKFGKPTILDTGGEKLSRSFDNLDEDGTPAVGSTLSNGDVIVGKVARSQTTDSNINLTGGPSQRLTAFEKGRVDQVVVLEDEVGCKNVKVKLRDARMPQVGDKFSSMHGQKGIIGATFTQEDLPFTNEGIAPDIILNPHAFPTRQTLGQLCESALGKVVARTGEKLFATPFTPSCTVKSISDLLQKAGFEKWGSEMMYSGFTGQAMEAPTFMGVTFYQRLTKMVQDQIKYRSRGHVHPLTRQPVAGRKRHGGVKFGEMERDCLIAHGAAATLQERTFILSDYHTVHVCTSCEQLANYSNPKGLPACGYCTRGTKRHGSALVKLELPYACKLLMQELMSMGLSVRLKTELM